MAKLSNQNNLTKIATSYDTDLLESNILVNGRIVGEMLFIPRRHIPLSSNFPAVSLTRIASYADILAADSPEFHAIMRNEFIEVEDDSETFHDEFAVDTISGQDITLTDTPENNYFVADIYEDALVHGGGEETPSYTNWLALTGDNGTDYSITGVNVGTRTITVSGTLGAFSYVKMSQYRVGGDSGRVRVYSWRGRTVVGAGSGEVISGFRRRDQMQGHEMTISAGQGSHNHPIVAGGTGGYTAADQRTGGGIYGSGQSIFTIRPSALPEMTADATISDGTNGTPRTGSTTHDKGSGVEVYQWLGRYLGA